MTTFIFCLIFLQVAIFLAAGVVLFTTFYASVGNRERNDTRANPSLASRPLEMAPMAGVGN